MQDKHNSDTSDGLTSMISLLLGYTEKVCFKHLDRLGRDGLSIYPIPLRHEEFIPLGSDKPQCLLQWVQNRDQKGELTKTYLDLDDENCRLAFVQLMRNPGPYDGGSGHILERRISHSAISMIFGPEAIYWTG